MHSIPPSLPDLLHSEPSLPVGGPSSSLPPLSYSHSLYLSYQRHLLAQSDPLLYRQWAQEQYAATLASAASLQAELLSSHDQPLPRRAMAPFSDTAQSKREFKYWLEALPFFFAGRAVWPSADMKRATVRTEEDAAEWKQAEQRRKARATFYNLGPLQHDTCNCCYRRYLRPYRVPESKAKAFPTGHVYDTEKEHARLLELLPDVMQDIACETPLRDSTGRPTPLWLCSICHESIQVRGRIPSISMQNGLLLGNVPPQLQDLNYMERHLISRVRAFHHLVYLPMGQMAAKGLNISYPTDVSEVRDVLPAPLDDTSYVFICTMASVDKEAAESDEESNQQLPRPQTRSRTRMRAQAVNAGDMIRHTVKPKQYKVHPRKIHAALDWLQVHNPAYFNISRYLDYNLEQLDEGTGEIVGRDLDRVVKEEEDDWEDGDESVSSSRPGSESAPLQLDPLLVRTRDLLHMEGIVDPANDSEPDVEGWDFTQGWEFGGEEEEVEEIEEDPDMLEDQDELLGQIAHILPQQHPPTEEEEEEEEDPELMQQYQLAQADDPLLAAYYDLASSSGCVSLVSDVDSVGSLSSAASRSVRLNFAGLSLPTVMDHSGVINPVSTSQPLPVAERILKPMGQLHQSTPLYQLQRIKTTKPIRINYEKSAEALAYPHIFVNGRNHYGTARFTKITPIEYFRSRLATKYRDRCMVDLSYLFFAVNALDWYQLESQVHILFKMRAGYQGQVVSHRRLRDIPLTDAALQSQDGAAGLSKQDLLNLAISDAQSDQQFVEETCFTFMQGIRGTMAYWNKCKRNLFSMLNMLGPPTWFVTFSANEMGWPECIMSIIGKSREEVEQMSTHEKQEAVSANPDLVAKYFDARWRFFFKTVLKGKGQPVGEIIDFFWRIEFQRRGSPHIHMLLWAKGAPLLDTEEGRVAAPAFIERYVSTCVPDEEGELKDLVTRLQTHHHTKTCEKGGGKCRCRFYMPRSPSATTRLTTDQDRGTGLPKRTLYVTKRVDGRDNWINAYNPELLLAWKSNMDIQFVSSLHLHGVVAYICAYMTKDEPESIQQCVRDALADLPPDSTRFRKIFKIGTVVLSKRELCAQEACYRILGIPLRSSSRTFLQLNTRPVEHRVRILRRDFHFLSDDSMDLFQGNVITRYGKRPTSEYGDGLEEQADSPRGRIDWENMTLAQFASFWNTLADTDKGKRKRQGKAIDPWNGPFTLLDGHTLIKRCKRKCLQLPYFNPSERNDDYYYSMLLLHLPWREERDILLDPASPGSYLRPMEAFVARAPEFRLSAGDHGEEEVGMHDTQFVQFAEEIEHACNQIHVLQRHDLDDAVDMDLTNRLSLSEQAERLAAGRWEDDNFLAFENGVSSEADAQLQDPDAVIRPPVNQPTQANRADLTVVRQEPVMPLTQFQKTVDSLRHYPKQYAVFKQIQKHVQQTYRIQRNIQTRQQAKQAESSETEPDPLPPPPLRLFISGGAGVGKSYLIQCVRELIMLASNNEGCMSCAPTGVAAFNIGGRTLHTALTILVDQKNTRLSSELVAPLQADKLAMAQQLWRPVKYLIIDEVSMVSDSMMAKVNLRLNQIKLTAEEQASNQFTFGNISVIAIGDFYQLKPVKAQYCFNPLSDSGKQLWSQFRLTELTQNVRQSGDTAWSELLNRVREGSLTDEDMAVLRTRLSRDSERERLGEEDKLRRRPLTEKQRRKRELQLLELDDPTLPPFDNALRIYSLKKDCEAYNRKRTAEMQRSRRNKVYKLVAVHCALNAAPGAGQIGVNNHQVDPKLIPDGDDNCGGLAEKLRLGVGSRVMLRRNISVLEGLVNGACGVIERFEWGEGKRDQEKPGDLPERVWVKFDNPRVGRVSVGLPRPGQPAPRHTAIAIELATARFEAAGNTTRFLTRTQVPLLLCWAATVHKVQGITLDYAVIDLQKPWCSALAYVAMSRVRSMKGLLIEGLGEKKRVGWAHPHVKDEYQRLRKL